MRRARWSVVLGLLMGLLPSAAAQAPSEEAYRFFELNCTSCHTVGGGRLAGPDLKDVSQRQERDWLVRFMLDPKAVIDSGDGYALDLLREAKGVVMNKVPGLDATLAGKLLDVIDVESALESSRFAGVQLSDRPLTAADEARGRALFRGELDFASGAPSCLSCHDVEGTGALGGGRLGPDLTSVYARMEGRAALGAWLSSPPSAVMAPVFRSQPLDSEEVLALTAYLKQTAESGVEAAGPGTLAFLLWGFGLAALVLVGFDVAWRDRYRATRRPLVHGGTP